MRKSKSFLAYGDVVYSNKLCANASANLLHHHAMQLYEELPSESVDHNPDSDMV
jgi:hypothetical protein